MRSRAGNPTRRRLPPFVRIQPEHRLIDGVFTPKPRRGTAEKPPHFHAQEQCCQPYRQHQRIHTQHARQNQEEIQPLAVHQKVSAGKAAAKHHRRRHDPQLINLQINDIIKETLNELGIDINRIEDREMDAGLGNGGLGRECT